MPETSDARAIGAVLEWLRAMHGWREWHWNAESDPFEIAVGSILVQNTAWTNVEHALVRLRQAGALDPGAMSALTDGELEELVRPSGQFRQKARKLRALLEVTERHGSFTALLRLPAEEFRAELLATWGIGPETADCIVLYAALQPSFVVDAYTVRLFGRLELGPGGRSYDTWQRWFEDALVRDAGLWAEFHALVVLHGKFLCRARAPRCGECALRPCCPFGQARAEGVP